jgi:hypothetical protein
MALEFIYLIEIMEVNYNKQNFSSQSHVGHSINLLGYGLNSTWRLF